ncbi:MAG: ATP-binding protein [Candidatus Promineifilaceae bacterium]|nr:ATP-binding protein [Candidatus Promineifilaceae bacterium]
MFRSLWFRLTGTVVALVIFTLGLALMATLVIAGRQFTEFVNNTSNEIVKITAPSGLVGGEPIIDLGGGPTGIEIKEDKQGGIEIGTDSGAGISVSPDGAVEFDSGSSAGLTMGEDGSVQITAGDQALSEINVQIPEIVRSQSTQLARDVQNTVLVAVTISGLLAILAGTWLFWQITRPLARLRVAADEIAAGKLDTRVQVKSKDEVGRVGLAFNHMAGQLQRQERLRKVMVADIAHELRTPLSVMQVNLEAMNDKLLPASPEELDGLHHEVLRLSRLVEDLRLLSLADAGKLLLRRDLIDVNALVETAVRRMQPQAEARGVLLGASLSTLPATISGDEDKLHQVLANLVSNALRFTPSGKRVVVSVQADRRQVTLQVTDEGPGIDPADLPDLFERFFKGDRARSRSDSGSGLGLSIVKQLVELHGGQVQASLTAAGGLQVTIQLPAAGADSHSRLVQS